MLRKKAVLVIAATIGIALVIVLALWSRTRTSAPPFLADVKQNAYDDFVRATKLLIGTTDQAEDLGEFLRLNRPALDLLRQGLRQKFEAPAETYDLQTFASLVIPNMGSLKPLAHALKAEGQHAEDAGNYRKAAAIYLELIQFGQKIQAGPTIFVLHGLSAEDLGFKALQKIEPKLESADRIKAAAELERLNKTRISFEEVVKRERYFMRRSSPTPFHYFMGLRMTQSAIDSAAKKYERQVKWELEFAEKLRKGATEPAAK
jgi:hypothetical protein